MDQQMHNFEQVKDVLDYGIQLHGQLTDLYDSLNQQNDQARVKMLLDYLSRHEKNREQAMQRFEDESRKSILNFWLQYSPGSNVEQLLRDAAVRPDMSVDDVIKIAMAFDNAMIELYKGAAIIVDDPHAKEVFTNLAEMEEQEKHRFIRDAEWMDDL
jgi:rubrerythrin